MDWLSRFKKMVEELKGHPQIHLFNFHTFPPVELSQFDILEKKYSLKFPPAVFDFYKRTNGLQLRWAFKNNEHYPDINPQSPQPLPWNYFKKTYRWEDGGVMILPLEKAIETKKIDIFSQEHNSIITNKDFVVSISEDEFQSDDFYSSDVESYLEFLIAGKGLISRRKYFYKKTDVSKAKGQNQIHTPESFWTDRKILNLDQALLRDRFHFCDQICFSESQVNRSNLQALAQNGTRVSQKDLEENVESHHQFLLSGGAEGEWKVLEIRGVVTAFYHHSNEALEEEPISFERTNLTKNNFKKLEVPFANFCAVYAEGVDFSNSNLEGSLFADGFLQEANFYNGNLTRTDFSRSDLRNANFQKANLTNADFENCDLRGANFEGAKLDGASFVGAIL